LVFRRLSSPGARIHPSGSGWAMDRFDEIDRLGDLDAYRNGGGRMALKL
jgi:hypothetical protein